MAIGCFFWGSLRVFHGVRCRRKKGPPKSESNIVYLGEPTLVGQSVGGYLGGSEATGVEVFS